MDRDRAPSSLRNRKFRLRDRLVHADLNRIERGVDSFSVEPRVMDVLVHLAEHEGEVITREEMLDRIWNGTIVVEHVLTRAVSELRRILKDPTEHPLFIETIRKRGYRLIAPVEVIPAPGAEGEGERETGAEMAAARSPATSIAAPRSALRRRLGWAAAVVAALGVAALIAGRAQLATRPPAMLAVVPFTSYAGDEHSAAFSPDGGQVAFVWTGPQQDNADIYVKRPGTETPQRLTTDPAFDAQPVWSPDGQRIAFVRSTSDGTTILSITPDGEVEQRIYAARSRIQGLDWTRDGAALVFSERDSIGASYRLRVLDLERAITRDLTAPPQQVMDIAPALSPSGDQVAFVRASLVAEQHLCLVPLAGGEVREISGPLLAVYGIAWRDRGLELLVATSPTGPASLWSLSVADGRMTPLIVRDTWVGEPTCRQGGRGLVYETWRCQSNVWQVDLDLAAADGEPIGVEEAQPIIQSTYWDGHARYAPGAAGILFNSARSGAAELWRCDPGGGHPVRLTHWDGRSVGPPAWSPDERRACYSAAPEGYAQLYVIDLAEGSSRRLTRGQHSDQACDWSPDGQWIYFASDRSGVWQIWKIPPGGGEAVQVTRQGGLEACVARDGRWLYYLKPLHPGLWRLPLPAGDEECVCEQVTGANRTNWCVAGSGLYFFGRDSEGRFVARCDLQTGEIRQVTRAPGLFGPGIHVAADESRLLYARTDETATDLMLVEEFR